MGLLEPITHKEEIQGLLDSAQSLYDGAKEKLESQKKKTTESLEKLGKLKIDSWSESMESFVEVFGSFKNLEIRQCIDTNMKFAGCDEKPGQMLINISNASMTAGEVAKAGFAAIGTGALVGVAAYGGAMMFAHASTGTAIAALSGIAKKNAALAWFGGGAKAAGGLGMTAGKLVLGGIVVAPILAVAALITSAKSKQKLAEAKKIHAEAEEAATQMNTITAGMAGVASISNNYSDFISKFDKKFRPFIQELRRIRDEHSYDDSSAQVDFNSLTETEQKTLHLSWLMGQIFYSMLSTPILTAEGTVAEEAKKTLASAEIGLKQIKKESAKYIGEEASIGNLIWEPAARNMMIACFILLASIVAISVLTFGSSILKGISLILCAVVAWPIFVIFKNLSASKRYRWRLVRFIAAALLSIAVLILL